MSDKSGMRMDSVPAKARLVPWRRGIQRTLIRIAPTLRRVEVPAGCIALHGERNFLNADAVAEVVFSPRSRWLKSIPVHGVPAD